MKVKLNQYDDMKKRFREKNEAKKPHTSKGHLTANDGKVRRAPKPKEKGMYNSKGFFNPDHTDLWI